jgi:uncharacterized protein YdhG (YjbR/CyaY superfamily)
MSPAPPGKRPKTVTEYIAAAPKPLRARLRNLRALVRAAAPGSVESLKWGSPAYSYRRVLVMFAYFNAHVSLFPTPAVIKAFEKDLAKFKTSSATIQFPHDKPLPKALIRRIVAFRSKDARERDSKWRTP